MNKEQQNFAWACLPKEARDYAKRIYQYECKAKDYNEGANDTLESIFGSHNLTSDTEPEKVFCIKRVWAQSDYVELEKLHKMTNNPYTKSFIKGKMDMMRDLFGDECLPEPSVQGEPRFRKGDRVIVIDNIRAIYPDPMTIKGVSLAEDGKYCYNVIECGVKFHEDNLEPYTEPSNVSGNETKNETKESGNKEGKQGNNSEIPNQTKYNMEENPISDPDIDYDEVMKKRIKDIEEKELNLCELLKGCEGEEIYTTYAGTVTIASINEDHNYIEFVEDGIEGVMLNGKFSQTKDDVVVAYPSRALYEKYPLDAYSAWMEWKEERKPKFKFEVYLSGYNNGVMMADIAVKEQFQFKTYEEIMKAAKFVGECLEKFHKNNAEK